MRTIEIADLYRDVDSLLAQIQESREPFLLTENGEAVAEIKPLPLKPPALKAGETSLDWFRIPGKGAIRGDITAPLYSDEELEEFFEASARQLEGR